MAVTESPSWRRWKTVSAIFFFASARTMKLFMNNRSMPERLKVLNAWLGCSTIGSPFRLNDVFMITGTPVRIRNIRAGRTRPGLRKQHLTAVLAAVWPDRDLFALSAPGTVTVEDDGFTRFKPGKNGRHRFLVLDTLECGIALAGSEVKSLRDGRLQLKESYVQLRNGEAFLTGAHISPLESASTHVQANPTRSRKLLLNRGEIARLVGAVERKGYTLVPLSMYWVRGRAKLKVGLGRGKKDYDKRATDKDRDWARDKQRLMRSR